MKPVGKRHAGEPHVAFDERGGETERRPGLRHRHRAKAAGQRLLPGTHRHRAPPRLYSHDALSFDVRRGVFKGAAPLRSRGTGVDEPLPVDCGILTDLFSLIAAQTRRRAGSDRPLPSAKASTTRVWTPCSWPCRSPGAARPPSTPDGCSGCTPRSARSGFMPTKTATTPC